MTHLIQIVHSLHARQEWIVRSRNLRTFPASAALREFLASRARRLEACVASTALCHRSRGGRSSKLQADRFCQSPDPNRGENPRLQIRWWESPAFGTKFFRCDGPARLPALAAAGKPEVYFPENAQLRR